MSETSSVRMADNKASRKRKVKGSSATPERTETPVETQVNGTTEGSGDNQHLKELQKQHRNVVKKLAAVSKTESVIAEFKTLSLDELVSQKKINADQKAQISKKSSLEEQKTQIETQMKVIEDLQQEFEAKFTQDKQKLQKDHEAEIERVKEEHGKTSTTNADSKVREALQITCSFLNDAAAQRQREDVGDVESQAYEAVLFGLYQGNANALETILKVVQGSTEKIEDPSGNELDYTFDQIKSKAVAAAATWAGDDEEQSETANAEPETDPTIANATLTELEDTTAMKTMSEQAQETVAPEQSSTTAEAANAVAESSWNPEASITSNATGAEDWVQVPRDPAETETGSAAPAVQTSTSNWADEAGAAAEEQGFTTPTNENDGFSEVRRERGGRGGRGRGGSRGEHRGRGRGRGEFRGRGGRGRGQRGGAPTATPQPS